MKLELEMMTYYQSPTHVHNYFWSLILISLAYISDGKSTIYINKTVYITINNLITYQCTIFTP